MKALIAILLLMGAFWVVQQLFKSYQSVQKPSGTQPAESSQPSSSAASTLSGLPPPLEPSLAAAEKQGAAGLKEWLRLNRAHVRDPRLGAIELDYAVLISLQDPAEARRIFQEVKSRTPTFSPLYDRVKRLEKSLQ